MSTSQLTQQEINQKRREKILARSRRLQLSQQPQAQQQQPSSTSPTSHNQPESQTAPLISNPTSTLPSTPKTCSPQADAFTRFRQLQTKTQRQKYLLIFAKVLGVIIAIVQLYLLTVIKKYQTKYTNNEITLQVFQRLQSKFIDEMDLIFWACFGTIAFSWIWLKFVRASRQNTEKIQIVPGVTMVTLLEQLNKVLEYKVLIKALLGYAFTCVVVHLVLNQVVLWFGWGDMFFRPDLVKILGQSMVGQSGQNQQIL